jgi:hypothetical protein
MQSSNLPAVGRGRGNSDSSRLGAAREKVSGLNMVEFNEDDLEDDPLGRKALEKIDFSWSGTHCAKEERQY